MRMRIAIVSGADYIQLQSFACFKCQCYTSDFVFLRPREVRRTLLVAGMTLPRKANMEGFPKKIKSAGHHSDWSPASGSLHSSAFKGKSYVRHAMGSMQSPGRCGKSYVPGGLNDRARDGRGERQEGDFRERDKWKEKGRVKIQVRDGEKMYKMTVDMEVGGKKVLQQVVGTAEESMLIDGNNCVVNLTHTVKEISLKHGGTLRVVPRDRVGVDGLADAADSNEGNAMQVEEEAVPEPVPAPETAAVDNGPYKTHQFNEDLGFDSMEDMLKRPSDPVNDEVPRQLLIEDVGDVKFSRHPRRMLMPVITRFLELEDNEERPNVYMFKKDDVQMVCVEVSKDKHAEKLVGADAMFGVAIKVTPHPFGNFSRATVWDAEGIFAPFSDEELGDLLQQHGVVSITREKYKDRKTGELRPGKKYRVTFKTRVSPKCLKFPDLAIQYETTPYVPQPLRCHRCQKFGHTKTNCRTLEKDQVCFICAQVHVDKDARCKEKALCANCRGPHVASSMECPAYKQEKAMKTESVEKRCAPVQVMRNWKAQGKYVVFSKSTARAVAASEPRDKGRTDKIEKDIHDIKQILCGLVNQAKPTGGSDQSPDERSYHEIQEENNTLVEQIQTLTAEVQEAHDVREAVEELRKEVQQLRAENAELKRERAAKTPTLERDEVAQLKEALDDVQEKFQSQMQEKDNMIIDLEKNLKKTFGEACQKIIDDKDGKYNELEERFKQQEAVIQELRNEAQQKDAKISRLNDEKKRQHRSTEEPGPRDSNTNRERSTNRGGSDSRSIQPPSSYQKPPSR